MTLGKLFSNLAELTPSSVKWERNTIALPLAFVEIKRHNNM
jgi:hypothetical protein